MYCRFALPPVHLFTPTLMLQNGLFVKAGNKCGGSLHFVARLHLKTCNRSGENLSHVAKILGRTWGLLLQWPVHQTCTKPGPASTP